MSFEKIHYPVALEVHQDGARGVAFPKAEVVHAERAHFLGVGKKGTPDTVQERVGTDEQTELSGQPGSRLAAQGERDPLKRSPAAVGAAGEGMGHLFQALGEDPALAGGFVAEELPYPNPQAHRRAAPG